MGPQESRFGSSSSNEAEGAGGAGPRQPGAVPAAETRRGALRPARDGVTAGGRGTGWSQGRSGSIRRKGSAPARRSGEAGRAAAEPRA